MAADPGEEAVVAVLAKSGEQLGSARHNAAMHALVEWGPPVVAAALLIL